MTPEAELNLHQGDMSAQRLADAQGKFATLQYGFESLDKDKITAVELQALRSLLREIETDLNLIESEGDDN